MPQLMPPPVPLSMVGRAMHDVGVAGLLGGNLFGRLALHPSVTEIGDALERGKVVNAAWRRYGAVQTASLIAVAAAVTGLAIAAEGIRFSRMAPAGAVPLADGDHTAAGDPQRQAAAKRRLNVLGLATLAAEVALVGANAALSQESFRRPPARRRLSPRLR